MTLKTKGGHTPKAGPKSRRAKGEELLLRAAIEEHKRRGKLKASRKASAVREYRYKTSDKQEGQRLRRLTEAELMYQLRIPQGLSPEARWMEQRPTGFNPYEWWLLFDRDEGLWPFIIELAEEGINV